MHKTILTFLFLLSIALTVHAGINQWETYTTDDGLAGNIVNAIAEDDDGNLWFGTNKGLSKFDGFEFQNFTTKDGLVHDSVMRIIIRKPNNNLILVTQDGSVSIYDGKYFQNFKLEPPVTMYWSPSRLYEDSYGNLWLGTQRDGLIKFDGKQFQRFTVENGLPCNDVSSILEDRNGNIWVGLYRDYLGVSGYGGGVCKYDGQSIQSFTGQNGPAGISPIHGAYPRYEASDGSLWFTWRGSGRTGSGVSRFDGKRFQRERGGRAHSFLEDRQGNLWVISGAGVSKYDGEGFQHFKHNFGSLRFSYPPLLDREGNIWVSGTNGVTKFDGTNFQNFSTKYQLKYNQVSPILEDRNGNIWFGTLGGGVSLFDNRSFLNIKTEEQPNSFPPFFEQYPDNLITDFKDKAKNLWFITKDGVKRYDGKRFHDFTIADGLPNDVRKIKEDRNGDLWFLSAGNGVSKYTPSPALQDGKRFQHFTTKDGLASNKGSDFLEDRGGNLWFWSGEGASRYDGQRFQTFTTAEGLPSNHVRSILENKVGNLWFATDAGLSRYDGTLFQTFTIADGLPSSNIKKILENKEGELWFTTDMGVCQYDGIRFHAFAPVDHPIGVGNIYEDPQGDLLYHAGTYGGICFKYDGQDFQDINDELGIVGWRGEEGNNWNISVVFPKDSEGYFWIGTRSGGIIKYDGMVARRFTMQDGLAGDTIRQIKEDNKGDIWFLTDRGYTKYTPHRVPPRIRITHVIADKPYQKVDEIKLQGKEQRITFEYRGVDPVTQQEDMLYMYKLDGYDSDWSFPTKETRVDYMGLKPNTYTFQVKAIDRDLYYSEPVTVQLTILPPPFYMRSSFIASTVGCGIILVAVLTIVSIRYLKRQRQVRAYERAAVQELQDANQVQMGLMPETPPPIEGVEIAGKCIPANTVSGDFFDYLEGKRNSEIALVVADVTGKAMKGAMNAVMTDGILRTAAIEQEDFTPASLMMTLNNALKGRLEQYMNVTMVIGMINSETKTLTLANAAHHAYPLLLHNGEVQTLKTGGLPLGMKAGIQYTEEQWALQRGDILILMTDGIIESQDSEGIMYSDSGRLENTISKFTTDISAEAMVNAIIADAIDFGGEKASRDDDMTVVVAKMQ